MADKKVNTHKTKSASKRVKSPVKKVKKQKLTFISKFVPKTKKGVAGLVLSAVVIIIIAGAIPFPYTFAKTVSVDYVIKDESFAGLELGDSKTIQDGRNGNKVVTTDSLQSFWGRLLGLQPIQQKVKNETIKDVAVDKVVANGSRKYQYMMCSDGRYRYFTDEQFKDPNTGFTSKSNDYCKENNQGVKVNLADSPDGAVSNQVAPSTISKTPTPAGCKNTPVPFKVEYQNVSYLPRGTQQVASQGMDGFILSCPGSADIKSSGVNQVVLVGTGKTDAEVQAEKDAAEVQAQQAEAARTQRYYVNLANCVQNLKAQGVPQSTAEANCYRIITR